MSRRHDSGSGKRCTPYPDAPANLSFYSLCGAPVVPPLRPPSGQGSWEVRQGWDTATTAWMKSSSTGPVHQAVVGAGLQSMKARSPRGRSTRNTNLPAGTDRSSSTQRPQTARSFGPWNPRSEARVESTGRPRPEGAGSGSVVVRAVGLHPLHRHILTAGGNQVGPGGPLSLQRLEGDVLPPWTPPAPRSGGGAWGGRFRGSAQWPVPHEDSTIRKVAQRPQPPRPLPLPPSPGPRRRPRCAGSRLHSRLRNISGSPPRTSKWPSSVSSKVA